MDLNTAKLYASINQYKNKVRKTVDFIINSLNKVNNPYLACSFGKDSSVMLDLVINIYPKIPVRFASHPETRLLDNYQDVIDWWSSKINLEEIYCDGELIKVKHHQRKMLNKGEWDSYFVGIRAEESFGRRLSLKTHGDFYLNKNGRVRICPMSWWSTRDIETYTLINCLPILNKYKLKGIKSRTSSGIPRTNINECLSSLKSMDINSFNKLCEIFPDARHFV